jgi:hypothetical protein
MAQKRKQMAKKKNFFWEKLDQEQPATFTVSTFSYKLQVQIP